MEDLPCQCKRNARAIDPDNSEAIRLQQLCDRKKQRLTEATVHPRPPTAAKVCENVPPAPRAPVPQASVEDVEDEDMIQSMHHPKPRNPSTILESSEDDDEDEIQIVEPSMNTQQKKKAARREKAAPVPAPSDEDDVPEEPEESAEAELSALQSMLR